MSSPSTKASSGAVIIDSGLRSHGGHNYFYTREVQHALRRLGIKVRVLVNRGFPSEEAQAEGFTPAFSVGAHDHALGRGFFPDLAYVHAQSVVFAHELGAALGEKSGEFVFSHTLGDFELIGWRRFLRRHAFPGRLALLMRVVHGAASAGWIRQGLHPYIIKPRSLRAIGGLLGDRFTLVTDSEALSAGYSSVFAGRIVTLPIPVAKDSDLQPADPSPSTGLCVGYVGDARESKGFNLLPGALRDLLVKAPATTHFVVQMSWPSQGRGLAEAPSGVAELEALATAHPSRIKLIRHKLGPDEYWRTINALDVVLLPYSTPFYREATSGIFAEALHLGKVVVVSSDTWMAHELRRSEGGTVHRRGDAGDLVAQTLQAIDGFDQYQKRARAFQPEWQAFHNPDELARILLRSTGFPSTAVSERGGA